MNNREILTLVTEETKMTIIDNTLHVDDITCNDVEVGSTPSTQISFENGKLFIDDRELSESMKRILIRFLQEVL